jgi:hypothetical protein
MPVLVGTVPEPLLERLQPNSGTLDEEGSRRFSIHAGLPTHEKHTSSWKEVHS